MRNKCVSAKVLIVGTYFCSEMNLIKKVAYFAIIKIEQEHEN